MKTETPEQVALGKAAVLYAFGCGASVRALAVVYEMSEQEVEELIRLAMSNLMRRAGSSVEGEEVEEHGTL